LKEKEEALYDRKCKDAYSFTQIWVVQIFYALLDSNFDSKRTVLIQN